MIKRFFNKLYTLLKLLRALNSIRKSKLFDKAWYLEHYPDVAQARMDPALHYLRFGGFEGRDPGPNFSSKWYLASYEDVKIAGMNPLAHYLKFGITEGRGIKSQNYYILNSPGIQRHSPPPDFMIIGAQKAGTTALYSYLVIHPGISTTKVKEHHFFNCEKNYAKGELFYQNIFPITSQDKLTFDASPGYLASLKSASRIYQYNPNVKIIALLRNPVERAYSAWQMYKKRYENNKNWFYNDWVISCDNEVVDYKKRKDSRIFNFRTYIEDEITCLDKKVLIEAPVVIHGFYAQQLNRYFELFNKKQILIIHSDELRNQTCETLKSIQDFIGVQYHEYAVEDLAPVFEGGYTEKIETTVQSLLSDYYKPYNEQLYSLLGIRYGW